MYVMEDIEELLGQTLVRVERTANGNILFESQDGTFYVLTHLQDCCESVYIDDIVGDLDALVGSPILMADEATRRNDSQTWTFYKFATMKGYVDIRWCGSSNGYYSESADFIKLGDPSEHTAY